MLEDMIDVKIPVEIRFQDTLIYKKEVHVSDTQDKDFNTSFSTHAWDKNFPQIAFIQFLLPHRIVINVDRPCKLDENGWLIGLEPEPAEEPVTA